MPTYRLDLAYDGSGFRGYAANNGVRTVQGELEAALATILGRHTSTVVAGRTDAGVHAEGQVVSFSHPGPIDTARVQRSLNTMLGGEVVAKAISVVPDGFSARFSAKARTYHYLVNDGPVVRPLDRWHVWHVEWELDEHAMDRAAAQFVGDHDFASFCRSAEGKTTTRTVHEAGWTRHTEGLVFGVVGRAFCHQMVRSMVGLSVDVGRGRVDPDTVADIIGARDRGRVGTVAPPHGLTLVAVAY